MTRLLYRWLLFTGALYLTAYIVPGIDIEGAWSAFAAAALLALLNALLRSLILLLTLPITVLTLGLFVLVVNALMLWLAGNMGIAGFSVQSFAVAFLGSLLLSLLSMFLNRLSAVE